MHRSGTRPTLRPVMWIPDDKIVNPIVVIISMSDRIGSYGPRPRSQNKAARHLRWRFVKTKGETLEALGPIKDVSRRPS